MLIKTNLQIWQNNPKETYKALKIKEYSEVSEANTPTLGLMKKEIGVNASTDILTILVVDIVKFFNVGKTFNKEQVIATVELILDEFPEISIADLKLCFNKAKLGEYGKLYDRLDGAIIFSWVREYCDNKMSWAINRSENEHRKYKDHENYARIEQVEQIRANSAREKNKEVMKLQDLERIKQLIDESKPKNK
jgi:hypothetical protein